MKISLLRLLTVNQEALQNGWLPVTLSSAVINLLNKKRRDSQYSESYQVTYMNKYWLINSATRESTFINMYLAKIDLHIKSKNNVDCKVAFLLEVVNMFDKIELNIFVYTMKKFGFGPSIMQWEWLQ